MERFVAFILLIAILQLATAGLGQSVCTYLNDDCGRLPEYVYQGTRNNPTTIYYQQSTIRFSNGAVFAGRRLSFTSGGSSGGSSSPYLGVWRIPKGVTLFVRFINQSPFNGNLHWHGLHVKGTNADDPSIIVSPSTEHRYEFDIGRDHTGGTYWIHPHYHTEAVEAISGCALGMVIIEDDASNREVPVEVRTAETFNLILQYHQPQFWIPSNTTFQPFLTVNGISNNPILAIRQQKWMRLRILSTGVSFGNLIQGTITVPNNVQCTFVLIAKDGIYLRGPRVLQPPYLMIWTEASRADVMVHCDGPVGSTIQWKFGDLSMFRLEIQPRKDNEAGDSYSIDYNACLPRYLDDTFSDAITAPKISLSPFLSFQGFDPSNALGTFNVGQTIELALAGASHPFHIHVNHFQIQTDDIRGWYRRGDWHDTAEGVNVRMRLNRFSGLMLVHCHNMDHQDNLNTNGMIGTVYINGAETGDNTFAADCPNVVLLKSGTFAPVAAGPTSPPPTFKPTKKTKSPTTRKPTKPKPTKKPTTGKPSKSPTPDFSCKSYSRDSCPQEYCYIFNPPEDEVEAAISKLKPAAQEKCRSQLGCKGANKPFLCKYNCPQVCKLDERCKVAKVKGKQVCKAKPAPTPDPTKKPTKPKPTKKPTTGKPSKSPTPDFSCKSFSETDCPPEYCYIFNPPEEELEAAISNLKPAAQQKCRNQLGCKGANKPFLCKYNCPQICRLDERCKVATVKGKKVCKPKPVA